MTHEGEWIDVRSYSGQDDTAYIKCSCGWRTQAVWSRHHIPLIQRAFAEHKGTE